MSPASSAEDEQQPTGGAPGHDVPGAGGATATDLGGPRGSGAAQGRAHFQVQLQALEANALGGLDLIIEQLDRVLEALRHQDVELAQMVIADDDRVDGR